MIRNAIESLVNLYNWYRAPDEVKEHCINTLTRLKSSASKSITSIAVTKNDNDRARAVGVQSETNKVVSLFQSLPRATAPERKSVSHWCTLSAAAAREQRFAKIERSYDTDFRSAGNEDVIQLETYLSKNAEQSALSRYINRDKNMYDLSPATSVSVGSVEETVVMQRALDSGSSEQIALHSQLDEALFKLATDELDEVRVSVASNMHAPTPALWLLADDNCLDVRVAFVENEILPLNILEKLANDNDGRVARQAQSKLRKISAMEEGIVFGNLSTTSDFADRVYELHAPDKDVAV